ncbi:MAG: tail fiber domain-containing protein, partial [Cytophagales bacterium]
MKQFILFSILLSFLSSQAQNSLGINNESPSNKSALDVKGSFVAGQFQGVLVPRYPGNVNLGFGTLGNSNFGLMYFDTLTGVFRYHRGNDVWGVFGGESLTGLGSTNTVPYWTSTNSLGFSTLRTNGSVFSIGAAPDPNILLQITQSATFPALFSRNSGTGEAGWFQSSNTGGTALRVVGAGGTSNAALFLNGRVGVGTLTPEAVLDVEGTSGIPNVRMGSLSGTGQRLVYAMDDGRLNDTLFSAIGGGWSLTGNSATDANLNYLGTSDSRSLRFRTNAIERVFIDSLNGSVGIGTRPGWITGAGKYLSLSLGDGFSPPNGVISFEMKSRASALSVPFARIDFIQNNIGITYNSARIEAISGASATTHGQLGFFVSNGTLTERMRIAQNGNVGIGTTTPQVSLDILGGFATRLGVTEDLPAEVIALNVFNQTFKRYNCQSPTVLKGIVAGSDGQHLFIRPRSGSIQVVNSSPDALPTNQIIFNGTTLDLSTNSVLHLIYEANRWYVVERPQDATGPSGTGFNNRVAYWTSTNNLSFTGMVWDNTNSRLGIGSTVPTTDLSFDGNSSKTIGIERNSTVALPGSNLTITAGGAPLGQSNRAGGDLVLSSGISTGTGGSNILFNTATGGTTGTVDRVPSTKMIISTLGTIGVGTLTPFYSFHINNATVPELMLQSTLARNALGNQLGGIYFGDNNATTAQAGVLAFRDATGGAGDLPSRLEFTTTLDGGSTPSTRMVIKNDGNVGIGTVNPTSLLNISQANATADGVNGVFLDIYNSQTALNNITGIRLKTYGVANGYAKGGIFFQNTSGAGANGLGSIIFANNNLADATNARIADAVMTISSNKFVGIGTVTPSTNLHINSVSNLNTLFESANTAGTWAIFRNTSTGGQIFSIISSGSGNGEGAGKLLFMRNSAIGTTSGNIMTLDHATSNVGIGCTNPTARLHVNGTIIATSTISAGGASCSDSRYKKNILNLEEGISIIKKLEPRTYEWNIPEFPEWNFPKGRHYGFIAQEIEQILPNLVITDSTKNKYKAVDYSKLTPILTKAIQEQQQMIDSLKTS